MSSCFSQLKLSCLFKVATICTYCRPRCLSRNMGGLAEYESGWFRPPKSVQEDSLFALKGITVWEPAWNKHKRKRKKRNFFHSLYLCLSHVCAYFTSGNRREVSTSTSTNTYLSTSSAILNISRSPSTLLRLRMPYFLALVSHVRMSQVYGCAYACAYRTSGNQA